MFLILIITSLSLGYLFGIKMAYPERIYDYVLYLMVFVIGFDIGLHQKYKNFKLQAKAFFLPLATILGSIIGGIFSAYLLGYSIKWGAIIGGGACWYSLTGPLLTQYSVFFGLVGFLANLLREILTFVFYPLAAKILGKEIAIVMGGASTMDSTLPLIMKTSGAEVALIAFFHGLVVTLFVLIFFSFSSLFLQ